MQSARFAALQRSACVGSLSKCVSDIDGGPAAVAGWMQQQLRFCLPSLGAVGFRLCTLAEQSGMLTEPRVCSVLFCADVSFAHEVKRGNLPIFPRCCWTGVEVGRNLNCLWACSVRSSSCMDSRQCLLICLCAHSYTGKEG